MSPRLLLPLAITGLLAAAPAASAATKHGVTPVAPKAGSSVSAGQSPTFKMRVKGKGQVYVNVCKSRKKDSDGKICSTESIGKAKKKGSTFRYRPKFYDFPEFWLNTPGTYYWQAYRIACESGNLSDCSKGGPPVRFGGAG